MRDQTALLTHENGVPPDYSCYRGSFDFTSRRRGGARSRPLNEDAALALLQRTLKRDHVYEKRISLDCIAYGTEETTNAYFEFVLREIHNAKCGGDPETSPAIDRYRVYRRSGKIEQWEAAEDKW